MGNRLAGKTALVTAAAHGIGRATALAYAAEGAAVVATDIDEPALAELDGTAGIATRRLDVTDAAAIESLAAELGAVDVLLNIAGYVHHGTILECSEDDWDVSFDINVKSMYRTCRAFLPAMLEAGGGAIVNMSSGVSSVRGLPNRFVYGATKAAVIGLTKAIAADYIRRGIRCNAICPGTIATPSLEARIAAFDDPVRARRDFIQRQPLGRLGTAEEVAAVAVYLGSDEASYTTGTEVKVDGGLSL